MNPLSETLSGGLPASASVWLSAIENISVVLYEVIPRSRASQKRSVGLFS